MNRNRTIVTVALFVYQIVVLGLLEVFEDLEILWLPVALILGFHILGFVAVANFRYRSILAILQGWIFAANLALFLVGSVVFSIRWPGTCKGSDPVSGLSLMTGSLLASCSRPS